MQNDSICLSGYKPFPIDPQYMVSDNGLVYSLKSRKHLKTKVVKSGYVLVILFIKSKIRPFLVHRVVAITFLPNYDNLSDVNHIDGNKQNNELSNLEWISHADNIRHAHRIGLFKNANFGAHMIGKKLSKGTRQKMSERKIGKLHPKFTGAIITPFGKFESSYAAAIAEGTNHTSILRKIKSDKHNGYCRVSVT
jgi:hypothetical protein